jgi:hypothetical protein
MELTDQDLAAAAQIIDAAMQRGAFKAAEATVVGAVYNKLTAFIEAVKAQREAEAAAKAEQEQAESSAATATGEDAA